MHRAAALAAGAAHVAKRRSKGTAAERHLDLAGIAADDRRPTQAVTASAAGLHLQAFLLRLRTKIWFAPALLYVLTAALTARFSVADGYDGVGFVQAMQRLDLTRFAPQPPGYPLFVLLARLVHACGVPAAAALSLVSAALLGSGIGAAAAAVQRRVGGVAGGLVAVLLSLSPLCYALGLSTLSDGAGLGVLLLALAVLARGGRAAAFCGGALVGVALGIRPTYAPLAVLLVPFVGWHGGWQVAARACVSALAVVAAWLVPFALLIGPRMLWSLCLAHATGHVTDFGGAITAELKLGQPTPQALPTLPLLPLLRGLGESALGPLWPLGAGLLALALGLRPPRTWETAARRLGASLLVGLGGYGLFALIALPVRGHTRHLLPAAAALLVLFALAFSAALTGATGRRRLLVPGLGALLIGGLAVTTARTLQAFRQPSPGVALAQYVTAHYPPGTLLYGARAARYLDLYWGIGSARPTRHFGDVIAEAERLDHLPAEVLCTSEVQASVASQKLLRPLARFCYAPALPQGLRLDPYPDGCVELRSYRFRP